MNTDQTSSASLQVNLSWDRGRGWLSVSLDSFDLWIKGFAFKDGRLFRRREFASLFFESIRSAPVAHRADRLISLLRSLNGTFAVVLRDEGWLFAAVDRIRSIPLFYGMRDEGFCVSDQAGWIRRQLASKKPDPLSVREFILTGYVTGSETLFPGVRQLQAGECLWYAGSEDPSQPTTHRYYHWIHRDYYDAAEEQLQAEMNDMHLRVFERLSESTAGCTLVVPLSGGYDSRLIVTMLKRLGRDDVLCFSYGHPGNWESEISRRVAKTLGYRWLFVPYSHRKWHLWYEDDRRAAYDLCAFNLTSRPHYQDWPAVWALKEQGRIPEDAVFVPGHTGDFISGGHIPPAWVAVGKASTLTLLNGIKDKHYNLWQTDYASFSEHFGVRIVNRLAGSSWATPEEMASAFEYWEWRERQAKYIVNSVRVYEYWGYDWRIPLWDYEMLEYWARIPLEDRVGNKIYRRSLERLFATHDVDPVVRKRALRQIAAYRKLADPRIGRHQLRDVVGCLAYYREHFGSSLLASVKSSLNVMPLGIYVILRDRLGMRPSTNRCGFSAGSQRLCGDLGAGPIK